MAWTLIKRAQPSDNFADHREWMIDSKADLQPADDVIKDNLQSATYEDNVTGWQGGRTYQSLLGKTLKLYIDGTLTYNDVFEEQDFSDWGEVPCAIFSVNHINLVYDEDSENWIFEYNVSGDTPASHSSIKITTAGTTPVLPSDIGAPGSLIYTPDLKNIYMLNSSSQLVTIQEEDDEE